MKLLVLLALAGCTPSWKRCPDPLVARTPGARALSETGLYRDLQREELAEGVVPYRPEFELWADGATKRRWIWLPPDARIDTRDMDAWRFPVGTKLWKEFTRDGVRVETRMLQRVGDADDDWLAVAYVWNAAGTDALATPEGALDARGTAHDVPSARDCMGCHGGTPGRVLGFAAIQLNHDAPTSEWSLANLVAADRLTTNTPVPPIPGGERDRAVLGYVHANCAHCHNQHRPADPGGLRCWNPRRDVDLSLRVGELATVRDTALLRTGIGDVIEPGKPESSALFKRSRGDLHFFMARMPPLASERLDPALLPLLEAWIRDLR